MRVRSELKALGKGRTFNVYPGSENSLKPYMYDSDDIKYLHILIRTYSKDRSSDFAKIMDRDIDKCVVINYDEYPLPGAAFKDGTPIVNMAPLGATYLTDLQPADVYAAFAYSIIFGNYVKNKPFKTALVDQIALSFFSIFMTIYGKKSGLIGSFSTLAPTLRFLITLYVYDGLFGKKINTAIKKKVGSTLSVDYREIKLDYDFSELSGFLEAVKANGIIAISENVFSKDIIKVAGVVGIPMFEDVSRLFATILSIGIKGNNIFPSYFAKRIKNIYEKLYFYGARGLK